MSDDQFRELLATSRLGVLATIKRDGRPQMSVVTYGYDRDEDVLRISLTDDRAKTRNLRRDPRASLHVTSSNWSSWAVVEGRASLSAVAADPQDDAVEALVDYYRRTAGEHPDWNDYRTAMVRESRVLMTLPIEHIYGQPPQW